MPLVRALGLMSGTSLDGVDVAMIETDGEALVKQGPAAYRPYTDEERDLLRAALRDARSLGDRDSRPGTLRRAEDMVTRAHVEAVAAFVAQQGLPRESIDVIGFHGQTVLHRPEVGLTVQIGDGPALADAVGVPVVYDLRAADVAAGGQGAPLVPVYHRALVQQSRQAGRDLPGCVAVLNLGGVANATIIDATGGLLATDAGPANALLDDFIRLRRGAPFDANGALAATGRVDPAVLARLLEHPFFEQPAPKSLDRDAFENRLLDQASDADGAATLTAFSAQGLARLLPHLRTPPDLWIACGGGARNPTLLRMISDAVAAPVVTADTVGWSVEAMEAQAFAYLAVRSQRRLPLTFPETTGVAKPTRGGVRVEPGNVAALTRSSP